jgi:hypothetical protein
MIDEEVLSKTREALKAASRIIIGIQATGGYRYRQMIKASDVEIQKFCMESLGNFQRLYVEHVVAEAMLAEIDNRLFSGSRWEEYQKRVMAVTVAIIREQEDRKRKENNGDRPVK